MTSFAHSAPAATASTFPRTREGAARSVSTIRGVRNGSAELQGLRGNLAEPSGVLSRDLRKNLEEVGARIAPSRTGFCVCVAKSKAKRQVEAMLDRPLDWHGLLPDPGFRSYGTSLVQDNYWCVPREDGGVVWWFLDGDQWAVPLTATLDSCLERITYFGRSETFTRIRRTSGDAAPPNCSVSERRVPGSVPLLVPSPDAQRVDVERVTDDADAIKRSIPPGSRMMYAVRPSASLCAEKPSLRACCDCRLFQIAIGWNVSPQLRSVARLTARFRGAVLKELLWIKTGNTKATWSNVDASIREQIADMTGKDTKGEPLAGHRHAKFLAWCEDGVPTRLLVWRGNHPFEKDEEDAILRAASHQLSWAAKGSDMDSWKVRLIPLDRAVPPPPGFDGVPARVWESVTPYVPPRHHLRGGTLRENESLVRQIQRELALGGSTGASKVRVEEIGDASWIAVHVPRRQAEKRASIGDRRGYNLRLTFPEPVSGPICLGHSSHFGLGLFAALPSWTT